MENFDQLIQKDIDGYEGRHEELIYQAPSIYRLLTHLLDDPNLPGKFRPLIIAAIAYFILPADIMPEDLKGPYGYADDIFLAALILQQIQNTLDSDDILDTNWDGSVPIGILIENILSEEKSLIGDKRELILWYIGYQYLQPQ